MLHPFLNQTSLQTYLRNICHIYTKVIIKVTHVLSYHWKCHSCFLWLPIYLPMTYLIENTVKMSKSKVTWDMKSRVVIMVNFFLKRSRSMYIVGVVNWTGIAVLESNVSCWNCAYKVTLWQSKHVTDVCRVIGCFLPSRRCPKLLLENPCMVIRKVTDTEHLVLLFSYYYP